MRFLICAVFSVFFFPFCLSAQGSTPLPHLHCSSGDNVPNVNLTSFAFNSGTSQVTGKQLNSVSVQLPLDATFPELLQDATAGTTFPNCRLTAYGANGLTLYITMINAHFTGIDVSGLDTLQGKPAQVSLGISFGSIEVQEVP